MLEPCLHQWKRRRVWSSYTYSLNYWLEISYRTTPNLKRSLWIGLVNVPNYNPTMTWESGIWRTLQFLILQGFAVFVVSFLSSVPPFLRLMWVYLVGNVLLFLSAVFYGGNKITWFLNEIKQLILPDSPFLSRTHRCPSGAG